jgi:hypothetical protein
VSDQHVAWELAQMLTPEHRCTVSLTAERELDDLDVLSLATRGRTGRRW